MKIKNIEIVPGCISCGTCEFVCPEIFEVKEIAQVKKGVDITSCSDAVDLAVDGCPVGVIKVTKE